MRNPGIFHLPGIPTKKCKIKFCKGFASREKIFHSPRVPAVLSSFPVLGAQEFPPSKEIPKVQNKFCKGFAPREEIFHIPRVPVVLLVSSSYPQTSPRYPYSGSGCPTFRDAHSPRDPVHLPSSRPLQQTHKAIKLRDTRKLRRKKEARGGRS